jgi:hypothetical protein
MAERTCSIEDCEKPARCRGWCHMHYHRWQRHGDAAYERPVVAVCAVEGCDAPPHARGLCATHYARWRKNGDPHIASSRVFTNIGRTCSVDGCHSASYARGWCVKHYSRWLRSGDPLRLAERPVRLCGVEGCGRKHSARGMCQRHWLQWRQSVAPPCAVAVCEKAAQTRGWCHGHYERWKKYGDPLGTAPPRPPRTPRPCEIEGCGKPRREGGLCSMHAWRLRRHGDVHHSRPTAAERIRDLVSVRENGCWIWMGRFHFTGYGQLSIKRRTTLAHRASYVAFVGPIPDGYHVDHLCGIKACVCPDHLEAVLPRENIRRGSSPSGVNARKTHCVNGHEFSDENTRLSPTGARICRACAAAARARAYATTGA